MPDRVVQGTAGVFSVTLYVGETATDSSTTVTCTATRDDGTVVFTARSTTHPGTGQYSVALTAADTALLDWLTLSWSVTLGGVAQTVKTYVEVVGGFYFSVPQLRALSGLSDTAKYPTSALQSIRTLVESEIEGELGFSFVPRYARETTYGHASLLLTLSRMEIRAIRWGTITPLFGTAPYTWTANDLAQIQIQGGGELYRARGWNTGDVVVVGYEHGMDYVPQTISRAAMLLARKYLTADAGASGQIDPRAESIITPDGTLRLSTGGRFSQPEIDNAIDSWRVPVLY